VTSSTPAVKAESVTLTLKHVPSGTATLTRDPATSVLTVHLVLTGLAPRTKHPSHIHKGTCDTQGSPVIYPLGEVIADDHGNFVWNYTVSSVAAVPAGQWFVNIHTGPQLNTPEQYRAILCGDITQGGDSTSADMKAVPGTGNDATGTATLTFDKALGTLTVQVKAAGLDPATRHANHIHIGSCEAQGEVKYKLGELVADASGAAGATTTIQGVDAIGYGLWYVAIHQGSTADLGTQQGFTPVACANVVKTG
jgi:hypothetical protein